MKNHLRRPDAMAKRTPDEIININVGGKRFTARRSILCTDPGSRLTEWFRPTSAKGPPQDKAGNYFLDRDGKCFRYVLAYLRFKREKFAPKLALPSKVDEITRLLGEAEALNLGDLRDDCMEMLQRYQREEAGHVMAYVIGACRDLGALRFDGDKGAPDGPPRRNLMPTADDWDV